MNEDKKLIVGYDTEYVSTTDSHYPISTQLYVLKDNKPYFIEHLGYKLKFSQIAELIKEHYPEHKEIILVSHFGRSEIMGLEDGIDLVLQNKFMTIQKTLVGKAKYNDTNFEFVDTYLLTNTSLEKLGEWLGLKKPNSHGYRENNQMLEWYQSNPEEFKSYALRDAEITAKFYVSFIDTLRSYNLIGKKVPKTIGSTGERALFKVLLKGNHGSLGYRKEKIVNSSGKIRGAKLTTPNFIKQFEPAYYGGRNETYLYGIHEGEVYDYDLKNAYGNVLSNMPEWDFDKPFVTKNPKKLYKFLKKYPLSVGYVNIDFEFKPSVKYPSLPIKYDSGIYFVLSGSTVCTPQEFLVSYKHLRKCTLIAKVYKPIGASVVSTFVNELKTKRNNAKKEGNIFLSSALKLIINSLYGKFLQGFNKDKKSVDLKNSTTDKVVTSQIPESKISNYAIGSFITGCVRAQVGEYLHYFGAQNIKVGNCTTDGFTVFRKLTERELSHVGVLTEYMMKLSGECLLEEKHSGKNYLGIKTRGYAILEGENILCSATGMSLRKKSEKEKKDILLKEFLNLSPFKSTQYIQHTLPSIREWILTGRITPKEEYRSYNFDFDLKRSPIDLKMSGKTLSFETKPYELIEEAMLYRDSYRDFKRGKRQKETGKQIGTKNKLVSVKLLEEFSAYITLRASEFETVQRVNDKTPLKIFVNLLKRLRPELGYKKLSKITKLPHTTIRHWVKDYPMSESDLRRGANSELLVSLYKSQMAPHELLDWVIAEFKAWVSPQETTLREYLRGVRPLVSLNLGSLMPEMEVRACDIANKGDPLDAEKPI